MSQQRLTARCVLRAVMERINEATKMIGTMIMEVSKDVFVADPSGQELSREFCCCECGVADRRHGGVPSARLRCCLCQLSAE